MSEILYYPLFLITFYFMYKSFLEKGYKYNLLAGIFLGLIVLTRIAGLAVVLAYILITLIYLYKFRDYSQIKKKIINEYGILEQCSICQTGNIWNNEPLSLQLDHINGINNDHRLENLRLLCPNCHSQTETFSGKRKKTQQKQCKKCSQPISDKKFAKFCESCRTKEKQKNYIKRSKFNPNKEELTNVLKSNNWNYSATGRHYNVSDNSIRKKCKKLNITKEGRNSAN